MNSPSDISNLLPTEEEVEARRRALVAELSGANAPATRPTRRRPPRRAWLALALVPLIATAAATAAGVFSSDQMDINAGMGCYSQAKLAPEVIAVIGPVEDPVAACAEMWDRGEMRSDVNQAPPLVACTGENQPVRVMPGRSTATCDRLGLVPLPADYPDAARDWQPPPQPPVPTGATGGA